MGGRGLQRIQNRLLRTALLSVVTLGAFGMSWQVAHVAATAAHQAGDMVAPRAEVAARGLARTSPADASASRDGASGRSLVLAVGIPVSLVEGGASRALRVPRGSSPADVADAAGVRLGELDRVESPAADAVAAGDTVRVVRVTESESTVREAIAFPVSTLADASLITGRSVVVTAGVPGMAENTYRVRAADGVVEQRLLLRSLELQAPLAEVRRVGTKPPPVPSDIESIIRTAAGAWGADPDQLLRVAFCESRYNANAYNASSGASGLFQFMPRTFAVNSVRAGYGGASVFDPVASANTAAFMFSVGQARQWACK